MTQPRLKKRIIISVECLCYRWFSQCFPRVHYKLLYLHVEDEDVAVVAGGQDVGATELAVLDPENVDK